MVNFGGLRFCFDLTVGPFRAEFMFDILSTLYVLLYENPVDVGTKLKLMTFG